MEKRERTDREVDPEALLGDLELVRRVPVGLASPKEKETGSTSSGRQDVSVAFAVARGDRTRVCARYVPGSLEPCTG